jgi:hypothetical protein
MSYNSRPVSGQNYNPNGYAQMPTTEQQQRQAEAERIAGQWGVNVEKAKQGKKSKDRHGGGVKKGCMRSCCECFVGCFTGG